MLTPSNTPNSCGIVNYDYTTVDCSQLGEQLVSISGTNSEGEQLTCQVYINIIDETAPTASCKNITVQLNANGQANITASQIDNGSQDACGNVSLSLSRSGFNCNDLGVQMVTLTVSDESGNTATCSANVTVKDEVLPQVICKHIEVEFNGEESLSFDASAIFDAQASYDACGAVRFINQSLSTVSCDQVGQTLSSVVTAEDVNGNQNTCTAQISVIGLPCGFAETGIGSGAGADVDYDPVNNTYTLTSDGLNDYPDGNYVYAGTELCGDGEIIAHINDLTDNGRAGIAFMETLSTNSKMVGILLQNDGWARTEYRTATDGDLAYHHKNDTDVSWLKITREQQLFKTYTSANGIYWELAHAVNLFGLPECLHAGMISYSIDGTGISIAAFDEFYGNEGGQNREAFELQADKISQLEIAPNPFQDQTRITFSVETPAQVSLEIYNLQGQRIRSIFHGNAHAGQHTHFWNGQTDRGSLNSAGIYMLRLAIGQEVITRKLSLMR